MNEYIFYDYIFSNDELNQIRLEYQQKEWNRVDRNDTENRFWMPINTETPFQKILDTYLNYINEYASYQLKEKISNAGGYTVDTKIAKYVNGDGYGWHSDSINPFPENNSWYRQISSITYLNDDFVGGTTEFLDLVIQPEINKTLIFPSNWCFVHRGAPVIKGEKIILVQHFWM